MTDTIVFPGQVEWSGENPGISLKQQVDGPFTTLASFFRVVLSPHGRGHALVLLRSPQEADPAPERANVCLHDNEPLARYLVTEFVSHFGAFRGLPGLQGLAYRHLGLRFISRSWFNLDAVWAASLILVGAVALTVNAAGP